MPYRSGSISTPISQSDLSASTPYAVPQVGIDIATVPLAVGTWEEMNEDDSRNCRHCHDQSRWDLAAQREKSRRFHGPALANGKTCIDCHKGIAHNLPEEISQDYQVEGIDFP
jgi:hypothetical protein